MLSKAMSNKEGSWPAGGEEIAKRVEKQCDVLCDTTETLYTVYKKLDVLNHGDLWSSNRMFKIMEYTNIPVAVRAVYKMELDSKREDLASRSQKLLLHLVHCPEDEEIYSSKHLDTQWLGRLLKKDHRDNEPADIVSVKVESAVPKGENYTSVVMRVKMNVVTQSGSKKTVSMIVKSAKNSEEAVEVLKGFSVFRFETKMFTTILNQMEALMAEFNDKRDILWAKLYGYEPYSLIALEDLKEKNFTLIDRRAWQDLDQGLLVLRSIGRYHAMSKILIGRGLIDDADKGRYFAGNRGPVTLKLFNGGLHMLSKAMLNKEGSWPAGWEEIAKRIEKQSDVLCTTLETLYTDYDKKFDVLNHGDLWSSNMMFKMMEYTNIPVAVRFVDYQLPHLSSFMWDVVYYMHTSVKPSIRRQNQDLLLKAYHESLSDNLKFFKWHGYTPTLEDVRNEFVRLRPAAFGFVAALMPLTSGDTQDAMDLEKLLTHPPEEVFHQMIFSEAKFVREIGDDLKEFVKLGVI